MKAAMMYEGDALPGYEDIDEPVAQGSDEIVVQVRAVAIKHFDRGRATGRHYSSEAPRGKGRIIGSDGVCLLPDGTRVYALGGSGMLAERAVVARDRIVPLPAGIDDVTAAALPNAVIGAAMGLKYKAEIQPGDVVLVNGATGVTGRIAVQIAKHYGAKKVIATGRNPRSLDELKALGADEIVSVAQDDQGFTDRIKKIHSGTPIDVIIDYLWGHTAEMILACLRGDGSFTQRTRYVSVGSVTGDLIQLSAAHLRSVNLQLSGSGLGAWSKPQVRALFTEILPEMFDLAAQGKLKIQTVAHPIDRISGLWALDVPDGKRLVVTVA